MRFAKRNLLSAMVLSFFLAIAGMTVWVFLWTIGYGFYSQWFIQSSRNPGLVICKDGQALLQTYDARLRTYTYKDPDGNPVEAPGDKEARGGGISGRSSLHRPQQLFWESRIIGFHDAKTPPNYWYLICDNQSPRHGYFVGYAQVSKQLVGYIGSQGFRSNPPTDTEQFLIDDVGTLVGKHTRENASEGMEPIYFGGDSRESAPFLISDGKLQLVRLNDRTVETISLPTKIDSISYAEENVSNTNNPYRLLARGPEQIYMLTQTGSLLSTLPLPEAVHTLDLTLYNWWTDQPIIVTTDYTGTSDPNYYVTNCYWLNRDGAIAKHEQFKLAPKQQNSGPYFAIVMPAPSLLALAATMTVVSEVDRGGSPDLGSAAKEFFAKQWHGIAIVAVLTVVAALVTYRHHRRYAKSGSLAWAIFVLCFGVPGAIGYWLHRRWPLLLTCGQCGQSTPADQIACRSCARELPLPTQKQIEIFVEAA
jgi:hypothetical protein